MSHPKILLRALPNVEFVHGYPGIPASPDRPQANVRGTLELRIGQQPVKAKLLKVELRKIESIPSSSNRAEEHIDIIGQLPLWEAKEELEMLGSRDFPFTIRIPETVPPSVALKDGAGIRYEVTASLSMKGKKGIFRREGSLTIANSVPVVIDKHELHSTWPIYAQPESRQVPGNDLISLIVDRGNTCFAPGDRILVFATLKTDNLTPVVLRCFEFYLVETVTFQGGHHLHGKKHAANASRVTVVVEHKFPLSVTLYGGTHHRQEIGATLPSNHTTSTISSARHIDVSYKTRIRAIMDFHPPLEMDLPITITNWPRHVSAELTKRIGAASNLSTSRPPATPSISAGRSGHQHSHSHSHTHPMPPPMPPPTGALPSIPGITADAPPAVPPKSDVSSLNSPGPAGLISPINGSSSAPIMSVTPLTQPALTRTTTNTSVTEETIDIRPNTAATAGSSMLQRGGSLTSSSNHNHSVVPGEGSVPPLPTSAGTGVDEFGFNIPSAAGGLVSATAPARVTGAAGVVTPSREDPSPLESQTVNSANRYSTATVNGTGVGPGRRARGMSKLKVMNANNDIPEEPSPIRASAGASDGPHAAGGSGGQVNGQAKRTGNGNAWMSAEEEKKRLYESAKAQVERTQAHARGDSLDRDLSYLQQDPQPNPSPPQSVHSHHTQASHHNRSPSLSNGNTTSVRPAITTQSPTPTPPQASQPPSRWLSAEEEKRRLFETAQARVREATGLAPMSPDGSEAGGGGGGGSGGYASPYTTTNPVSTSSPKVQQRVLAGGGATPGRGQGSAGAYSTPQRPGLSTSVSGASSVYDATSPGPKPAMSAGAALYASAMGSINRSSSATATAPAPAGGHGAGGSMGVSSRGGTPRRNVSTGSPSNQGYQQQQVQDDPARAYYEARRAVEQRRRMEAGSPASPPAPMPGEAPIPYEELFGSGSSGAAAAGSSSGLSEKEMLRRRDEEAQRAEQAQGRQQPVPPSPALSAISNHPPLSEKEIMRRAFEARDAAIRAAGQTPPPMVAPGPNAGVSPAYVAGRVSRSASVASRPQPTPPPLAGAAAAPPGYETGPPAWFSPGGSGSGRPLTAAEEKAQLATQYASQDAQPPVRPPSQPQHYSPAPVPNRSLAPSPAAVGNDTTLTREKSIRSESSASEVFLRRDPSISAGKRRASQLPQPPAPPVPQIPASSATPPPTLYAGPGFDYSSVPPPPPLPPRPPQEYIEETKEVDRRTTLLSDLPLDFSSSFDLGFGGFGSITEESENGQAQHVGHGGYGQRT